MRKPHLGPGRFSGEMAERFSGEMAAGFAERLGMIPLGSQPKQPKREPPPPPDPAPEESEPRADDGDGFDGGALESGEAEEDMELFSDHGADDELEEEDVELGALGVIDHASDDELEEEEDATPCANAACGALPGRGYVAREAHRSRPS